jgi:hypothetical protein
LGEKNKIFLGKKQDFQEKDKFFLGKIQDSYRKQTRFSRKKTRFL